MDILDWGEGLFTLLDITNYRKNQYKLNARQSKLPDLQKMNEFIKSTKVIVENCRIMSKAIDES